VKPPASALRERLSAWTASHGEELAEAEPEMPAGITDRPADVWEALLAVADVAGGPWPERARAAAVALERVRAEATPSRGVQLLADVRSVFLVAGADRLKSEDLCARLAALPEAPWGDLRGHPINQRGLADRLRPYDIRPHKIRFGDTTAQGYQDVDFADAWSRYLPRPATGGTSGTRTGPGTETVPLTSGVPGVPAVPDPWEGQADVPERGPEHGDEPEEVEEVEWTA